MFHEMYRYNQPASCRGRIWTDAQVPADLRPGAPAGLPPSAAATLDGFFQRGCDLPCFPRARHRSPSHKENQGSGLPRPPGLYSSQQHEATLDKHSSHGGNEVRIRLRSGLHQAAQNGPNWKSCHVASRWEPNTNWSVLGGSARSSERSLSLRQVLGEHGCIQTAPGEG